MTDMTDSSNLLQQLAAQLASIQQTAGNTWGTQATAVAPIGLAVPLKVQTPAGDIRVYLQLPAEAASSMDTILNTIRTLMNQGYPLDTWQSRDSGSGWGNSGNGSNWNRGGSGWNRGGWRR